MPLVFADANAYLDAYRKHNMKNYRALLKSLAGLGGNLIVTEMVVLEVERNRLKIYIDENKIELPKPSDIKLSLPQFHRPDSEYRDLEVEKAMGAVRTAQQALVRATNEAQRQLNRLHLDNQRAIVDGADEASNILVDFFRRARTHSAKQLARARLRKETGQPPGKKEKGAPLGDEISWEQVLDQVRAQRTDSLWIVTRDGDYTVMVEKQTLLKPTLMRELREASPGITARVFPNLAEFMKARTQEMPDRTETLPARSLIDDARTELEEVLARPEIRREWQEHLETGGLAPLLRPDWKGPNGGRSARTALRVAMSMAGFPQDGVLDFDEAQAEKLLAILEADHDWSSITPRSDIRSSGPRPETGGEEEC